MQLAASGHTARAAFGADSAFLPAAIRLLSSPNWRTAEAAAQMLCELTVLPRDKADAQRRQAALRKVAAPLGKALLQLLRLAAPCTLSTADNGQGAGAVTSPAAGDATRGCASDASAVASASAELLPVGGDSIAAYRLCAWKHGICLAYGLAQTVGSAVGDAVPEMASVMLVVLYRGCCGLVDLEACTGKVGVGSHV